MFFSDKLPLIDAKDKDGQKYPKWQFLKLDLVFTGLKAGPMYAQSKRQEQK